METVKKFRTEGLPEVFYREGVEAYELMIAPKSKGEKGTEVVIGIDEERGVLLFFCRGRHEKRYEIPYREGGVKEAEPYEGYVTVDMSVFGDIYLTVMGLKRQTGDLGVDAGNRVRFTYREEDHSLKVVFTNYGAVRRTIFRLSGQRLLLFQALFESLKRKLPVITFHYSDPEKDVFCTTTYDRLSQTLTISHNAGQEELRDRSVFALKELVQRLFLHGQTLTHGFQVGKLTLTKEGKLFVAGKNLANKKMKILLSGEEVEVPVYPMRLWKVLT